MRPRRSPPLEVHRRVSRRRATRSFARALHRITTRPWTIMEVCGGQTHAIVRFGLDELLPKEVTLVHGPGCPVCVTPVELIDKAVAIAVAPGSDPLLVRRHAARARHRQGPAHRQGRGRRRAHRLLARWTPWRWRADNPDRQVVFFAVGFETTAPANAMAASPGQAAGPRQLLAARVARAGAAGDGGHPAFARQPRAGLPGRGPRLRGDGLPRVPGPRASGTACPSWSPGFEPVDILQGVTMCVKQLEAGRARGGEPVRPLGAARRQPGGAAPDGGGVPGRAAQVARHRRDRARAASGSRRPTRPSTPNRRFEGLGAITARESPECISGLILTGLKKPRGVPGLRPPLHARAASGSADGLVRRGLCRVLPLPPHRRCRQEV